MKRTIITIILGIFVPVNVFALGLGDLELKSALNQPFEARIQLLGATADELDNLNLRLADIAAFKRAGVDRPFILSKLRFELQREETAADYIRVYSRDAIREPFLNFLLEASWSNGRLYREYTVLLDPPLYDPNAGRRGISRAMEAESVIEDTALDFDEPVAEAEAEAETEMVVDEPVSVPTSYTDDEYGPTDSSDTLWSIASQTRPDSSVSVQQMMLAILRVNPDAFIANNINGLKRGQILAIPSLDEIETVSAADALSQAKMQHEIWQETRGIIAADTTQRADMASEPGDAGIDDVGEPADTSPVIASEADPELRLVAPTSDDIGAAEGHAASSAGTVSTQELVMANEQVETLSAQNTELKDQLSEAETIIQDLKRLIELKDDELAALQGQVAAVEDSVALAVEEDIAIVDDGAEPPLTGDVMPEDTAMDEADVGDAMAEDEPVDDSLAMVDDEVEDADAAVDDAEEAAEEDTVAEQPAPPPAKKSMLDQVLELVMANLIFIAGGIGGLIFLLIVAIAVIRSKKATSGEVPDSTMQASAFPDFEESVDEAGEAPAGETAEAAPAGETAEAAPAGDEAPLMASPPEEAAADEEPQVDLDVAAEESAADAGAEAAAEPEEDPLAEVNVFLAYEHFDQAEEFVRDAIEGNPDNLDFHSKLLEVFYAANNKKSYEEAAQVLHDKVNGEGPHWEMAVVMWQELSPGRALFEEPAEGEDEEAPAAAEAAGGGIVDLTAEEPAAEEDAGLDFDIGGAAEEAEPEAEPEAEAGSDDVLDITSGSDEDVLDVTAAMDSDASDEDLLDVTAAVGLEDEPESAEEAADAPAADEENLLDITGGGTDEDLLDVTAHTDLESEELEEDLLDVTAATSAGADSDELLEVSSDADSGEGEAEPAAEDASLDFDIGGLSMEEEAAAPEEATAEEAAPGDDDAGLEFELDTGSAEGDGDDAAELSLDEDTADEGIDLSLDDGGGELEIEAAGDEADGIELELDDSTAGDGDLDLSVDDAADDDGGAEFDLTIEEDEPEPAAADTTDDDGSLEIELDMDEPEAEIDMEGTVEIPSMAVDVEEDDDDDDDDDHTVFVPRSSEAEEQTEEDEVTTKLDLAKAYVELGDKDSAKSILDEILAEGNAEQKQQAQDLLDQI